VHISEKYSLEYFSELTPCLASEGISGIVGVVPNKGIWEMDLPRVEGVPGRPKELPDETVQTAKDVVGPKSPAT
jgi:hypothetical protein